MYFWLESIIISLTYFTRNDITFGIIMEDKKTDFLLNTLFILGKCFIRKCTETQPLLVFFMRELALYCKSLKYINNSKKTTEHY